MVKPDRFAAARKPQPATPHPVPMVAAARRTTQTAKQRNGQRTTPQRMGATHNANGYKRRSLPSNAPHVLHVLQYVGEIDAIHVD
ncbi:MAG: hypothetical protein C0483_18600 [Pirellula sp.]|nr:hypothetical protein [Pirellula sp.]